MNNIKEIIDVLIALAIIIAALISAFMRIWSLTSKMKDCMSTVQACITEDRAQEIVMNEIAKNNLVNDQKFDNVKDQLKFIGKNVDETKAMVEKLTIKMLGT
ncbi:MAG: hypothetical protein WC495_03715 [Patescibacteria group bacterium]|jgi:hypothetical protein